MINRYFIDNPTTLAIGDGLNDILMMQECNLSIEVCEDIKKVRLNTGDVIIDKLHSIKDLLLVYGRKSQYNME